MKIDVSNIEDWNVEIIYNIFLHTIKAYNKKGVSYQFSKIGTYSDFVNFLFNKNKMTIKFKNHADSVFNIYKDQQLSIGHFARIMNNEIAVNANLIEKYKGEYEAYKYLDNIMYYLLSLYACENDSFKACLYRFFNEVDFLYEIDVFPIDDFFKNFKISMSDEYPLDIFKVNLDKDYSIYIGNERKEIIDEIIELLLDITDNSMEKQLLEKLKKELE